MTNEKENPNVTFSRGDIPVLKVEGKTLPEVWEKSLLEVWQNGVAMKTQYDRPNDPAYDKINVIQK